MSSVVWNPFIYCWLNEAFRAKTKALLRCCLPLLCWRLLTGRRPLLAPSGPDGGSLPSIVGVGIAGDGRVLVVKGGGGGRRSSHRRIAANGMLLNKNGGTGTGNDGLKNGLEGASVSWSSSTMSATGRQQAISELISMSGLLEQDLLNSSTRYSLVGGSSRNGTANGNFATCSNANHSSNVANGSGHHHHHHLPLQYTKEQRLALTTTQSGRRKLHTSHCQLIMMLKMGSSAKDNKENNEEEEEEIDVEKDVTTKTTDVNLLSSTSPSVSSSIELEQTAKFKAGTGEPETTEKQENSAV